MNILIAEDNEINQMVLGRILTRLGYLSTVANNGLEVLKKLETETFDLILMDIQMPEMDGITATKMILNKYTSSDRPKIIALTAETSKNETLKYIEAGMDGVLTKPINVDELISLIKKIETTHAQAVEDKNSSFYGKNGDEHLVLDPNVLEEFREIMKEDGNTSVIEFVTLFKKNAPSILEQMANANSQSQINVLTNLIHSLKGNCGQIGAAKMADLCVKFEEEIRNQRIETYPILIKKLEKEFVSLDISLSDYLERINQ
jgi:CheY-like chemotaxis protein/HPt (histidine-containing phosphotransfer) domain-containing protein